jgi:protein CrcB
MPLPLVIFLGAGLGGVARYALSVWVQTAAGTAFPWGTLLINTTGSFVLAVLYAALDGTAAAPEWRAFVGIGLCGGYTTFSTFSYETIRATVLRGVTGFGAHARVHTDRIEVLSLDLPLVVEVVATEVEIEAVLPDLDRMIDGGLVTLERARVILYRPHDLPDDERWRHRIAGLEPDGLTQSSPSIERPTGSS